MIAVWVWVWVLLWPTVSRPVCLGIKHPCRAYDQIVIIITVRQLRVYWCGALSLQREEGSIVYKAAGSRQSSHSRVRVPWGLPSYFTVSDSRLPVPSAPTTRRNTLEVFEPRLYAGYVCILNDFSRVLPFYSFGRTE
jgi:hypothetical protein